MKLDLLTNATVIEDAIKFVSHRTKHEPKPYTSNTEEDDKSESDNHRLRLVIWRQN
jgi:hypothetical protein